MIKSLHIKILLCAQILGGSLLANDSLSTYLDLAYKNAPAIGQKWNDYLAEYQKSGQVSSLPDPEISVGVYIEPMEEMIGNRTADIQLMQMFPWFGVRKFAKQEMEQMALSKKDEAYTALLGTRYQVKLLWNQLIATKQKIAILQANLANLVTAEKLLMTQYKNPPMESGATQNGAMQNGSSGSSSINSSGNNGMNSMGTNQSSSPSTKKSNREMASNGTANSNPQLSDIYAIRLEKGNLENRIANTIHQNHNLKINFNALIGMPITDSIDIPNHFPMDSASTDTMTTIDHQIVDSILNQHPMVKMVTYEQSSYTSQEKMNRRMGYPMFGVGVNYSIFQPIAGSTNSMNGNDMIMPMVKLTLPIYRSKYQSAVKESQYKIRSTRFAAVNQLNMLRNEYYRSMSGLEEAKRRLSLYTEQLPLTHSAFTLAINAFSHSKNNLSSVIQAHGQLLSTSLSQIEAKEDLNNYAAAIEQLVSPISNEVINKEKP